MRKKKKKSGSSEKEQPRVDSTALALPVDALDAEEDLVENESHDEAADDEPIGNDDPLKTIYEADETGEKIDMTKLERKKFSRSTMIGLSLVGALVVAAAAVAGFLIFNPDQTPVNQEEAELAIEVPQKILSGDAMELVLTAKNKSRVAWGKAEITVRFPDGWTTNASEPQSENSFNNAWKLGKIDASASKSVTVKGQLIGEVDATKSMEVTLIYTPSNFQSEFKEVVTKALVISDSILTIELDGPVKAVDGQAMTTTLTIQNRSQNELDRVQVRLDLPKNIQLNSTDPAPTDEDDANIWTFDRLKPSEEKTILVHGTVSGKSGDRVTMKAKASLMNEQNQLNLQQETSLVTEIISPELEMELKLNGATEDQLVSLGDVLQYRIALKNASDLEYRDVRVSMNLDALSGDGTVRLLDWDRAEEVDAKQIEGSVVSWGKENVEELATLAPDEVVELRFGVPVVSDLPSTAAAATRLRIEGTAKISGFEAEGFEEVDVNIESKTISARLSSSFHLKPEARYYSEEFDQLGSGPLPPEVGQTTSYRMFFYLSNTLNELNDVVVSATLPSTVAFEEGVEVDEGTLSFDSKNHTVIWRVSSLASHTGTVHPTVTGSFIVSITPSKQDVGKSMVLVSKVVAAARDAFTDQKLTDDGGSLDTDLENDVGGQGKGNVADEF